MVLISNPRLARYTWAVLGYTLLVVLWGAFVRASFSGDGCGAHWPLCNGEIIPLSGETKTLVEFFHRVTSGLILPMMLVLVGWTFKAFPKGSQARKFAVLSLVFTLTEAAVGAKLVLSGLVATNTSVGRGVWMSLHLINTFILLASLTLTARAAAGGGPIKLKGQGAVGWAMGLAVVGVLVLGVSGAVTALGDQLFPADSLAEGLRQDLSPTSHLFVRLRALHPLIATSIGLYLVMIMGLVSQLRPSPAVRKMGVWLVSLFGLQILVGFVNVLLMAPVWMQIVHLLLADALWIFLVLASASALDATAPRKLLHPERVEHSEEAAVTSTTPQVATWKAYLALTKPRVISLLLFTTLAAMFIAQGGWPGGWLLWAVAIGGYMAAGSANAINMVYDRDIDQRMARTATRPTVTHQISSANALLFAAVLSVGSFALLTWAANLLSAMLAMAGLLFYVVIYTMILKRRTWHNIVIGGAAGAFPPLVGWAAVTNDLTPFAWVLFAIVFVWTPVHFWALAMLIKDDYAEAGIPMLPVVRSEHMTVVQIALYTFLTAVVSVIPLFQGEAGYVYLVGALLLNAVLVVRSFRLYQKPDRPNALWLFKYSMVYLALLFLMIAVDRAQWM